jgi:prepilin-type N-terminal cleavage/methylation domain-containing protein
MKNLRSNNGTGFTLIELMGVMAIIGILSAVVLPPLISKIEDANSVGEDANLEEIARALVAGIKAQGRIPNPTSNPTAADGWAAMATNYSVLGTNELIRSILTSTNDTVRRYFLSPALTNFLATNYATPARGWSTNNFTNGPLYLMLVSVSKDGLLFGSGCTTNNNMASNNVLFLQNWAKTNNSAGRVEVNNLDIVGNIAGTTNRWTNRGEFLHVKVVDLKQLFCRVELTDTACPPTATIQFNSSATYTNPSISFFSGSAVFDIRDDTLGPIVGRKLDAGPPADITVLRNPQPQYLDRESVLDAGIPDGSDGLGSPDEVTPALNPQPRFRIPASGSASTPPAGMFPANIQTFYVLKGTSLELWSSSSTASVLTTTIESDSSFKYFGTTWSRVD